MRGAEKFAERDRDSARICEADRGFDRGRSLARVARVFVRPRARRSRQRGFSLLIVFMLILIMVGLAMGVVLATQQDLSIAGQDREQAQSLYAAEYAVAMAKAYLLSTPNIYNAPGGPNGGWTPLLKSTDPNVQALLCQPLVNYPNNTAPGITPKTASVALPMPAPWTGPGGTGPSPVTYQFCFHNNADDPAYLDPPATGPTGDNDDSREKLSLLVIEAYGTGFNRAVTHLAVTVGGPANVQGTQNQARGTEAGNTGHTGQSN
jgi:hypothetical protein